MAKHPILSLTWRRKLLFVIVSAIVFSSIAATILLWPRSYVATSRLLLETKTGHQSAGIINTHIDILESSRVASRVRELLRLTSNPGAIERYQRSFIGGQTIEQFYTQQLRNGVSIAQRKDGNVIDISFRAADPTYATQVANTFAKAYIEVSRELQAAISQGKPSNDSVSVDAVLLDEAFIPLAPSSPKTLIGFIIASLLAPIVGLLAVLFTEALDRRVRNQIDLEEATGTNVLCIVGMGRRSRTLAILQTVFGFLLPSTRQKYL
jgi:uncharacterized protein involved in exopolysaccharide biosynthesis